MKRVAILQSNYLPWKGYFDLIASVDEFVFYDDVQYTRRNWRNRNRIKTPQGPAWLTVPVEVKGKYHQAVDETRIQGRDWAGQHLRAIALPLYYPLFTYVTNRRAEGIQIGFISRHADRFQTLKDWRIAAP